MRLPKLIDNVITYVSGALTRVFGLNDDAYPPTGTQPYEGEPSRKKRFSDW